MNPRVLHMEPLFVPHPYFSISHDRRKSTQNDAALYRKLQHFLAQGLSCKGVSVPWPAPKRQLGSTNFQQTTKNPPSYALGGFWGY